MKKYWKAITLCALTVLIIGSFYIQKGLAVETGLKVNFETVMGDESELDHLSFNANYEKANTYHNLEVTSEETVDANRMSLLENLNRAYSNPVYKRLVEEYRGFMRGKVISPENYYEDENIVAYASVDAESAMNFTMEIDVLNKVTGKNTTFELDFPEKGKYNWAFVAEVQFIGEKLKVFVRGSAGNSEIILATVNIEEQKLEKSELLLSSDGNWMDTSIIDDNYLSIDYKRYILFHVRDQGESTEDTNKEITNKSLMVYDLEKDELKAVPDLEGVQSMVYSSSIDDSILFIPVQTEKGVEIHQYDLEKGKWGDIIAFDLTSEKAKGPFEPYMNLTNGKFYMVNAVEEGHALLIGDIKSGKVLYEGILRVEKAGELQSDYRLYISGLKVDR